MCRWSMRASGRGARVVVGLPYRDKPLDNTRAPRTRHGPPDFHERVAGVTNTPTLARTLGLVIDVQVNDLGALRTASTIRCDVDVHGTEKYLSPETACATAGSRFPAVAETDRWAGGYGSVPRPATG
jgi:hypothetical protein